MKKDKLTKKNNQLQINFEVAEVPQSEVSMNDDIKVKSVDLNLAKVINFSQVSSYSKQMKENELRKFVLQNTKSF